MCLRFAFLLITRVASWLRLSQREETWKTAEILILRHQLAVLQRRQRQRLHLNWADRALIAVSTSRRRMFGVTLHHASEWPTRQARILTMELGALSGRVKFMIRARGSTFNAAFDAGLADAGIRTVLCNFRKPRMNAIA